MNKLDLITTALTNRTGRLGLIFQKHAPAIMLVGGLTGMVVSTVLACKATLKAEEILDEHSSKLAKIDQVWNSKPLKGHLPEPGDQPDALYTDQEHKKDLAITYIQTGVNFLKLYGPSLSLGGASVLCIVGSYGIMHKRQVAIIAAYNVISQSFSEYRKRVSDELGPDKDYSFRHNMKEEKIEEVDPATGKASKKKKAIQLYMDPEASGYARYFDASNPNWREDNTLNQYFLNAQKRYADDLLKARGHLFLNEVYNMLGFDHTPEGAVVGWVIGRGDDFVDFGIYREGNESFIRDGEKVVLLDFNVAGVIFNKI